MGRVKNKRIVTPRIVQPSRGPRAWLVVLLLATLAAWTWQSYDFGRQRAGYHSSTAADRIDLLKAQIRDLKAEREELRLVAASHERANQVDRDAVRQTQAEIRDLQDERAALRRQVAFLQQLLAAKEGPIQIKEFELEPDGDDAYRYRFTVARAQKEDEALEGEIRVAVRGQADGVERSLPLEALTRDGIISHKMRFRHFQRVEGTLRLPDDFLPLAFVVEVVPNDKKMKATLRAFDWRVAGA